MKKLFTHLTCTLFFFAFIMNVSASVKTDLSNCLSIKGATQRLDCYDTVAEYYASSSNIDPEIRVKPASAPAKAGPISQTNEQSPTSEKLQALKPQKPAVPKERTAEDAFGQVSSGESVESIQSTLVGEFKSWEKGMVFKLENGQKWKVTQSKMGYKKMINPKVTISRGIFGSFNAKIEGFNTVAKVKRIK